MTDNRPPEADPQQGLDHRFGQFPTAGMPRQGVFGRAAGCLSDSEFLPVWKKYPGAADTMIKAPNSDHLERI